MTDLQINIRSRYRNKKQILCNFRQEDVITITTWLLYKFKTFIESYQITDLSGLTLRSYTIANVSCLFKATKKWGEWMVWDVYVIQSWDSREKSDWISTPEDLRGVCEVLRSFRCLWKHGVRRLSDRHAAQRFTDGMAELLCWRLL